MNEKINICTMTDEAIETIRRNTEKTSKFIIENPESNTWINQICSEPPFIQKKYKIVPFELLKCENDYPSVAFENAITLYEHLNKLPRYILSDEKFWAWMNFDYCYSTATQAMPIKSKSTIGDHYLFNQGQRRGIMFGVLSREYFRVDMSIDTDNNDKYELTKFVYDNIERIRNLTWRADSNCKSIVLGTLYGEKEFVDQCKKNNEEYAILKKAESGTDNIYTKVAEQVSLYGSVRCMDVESVDDIRNMVFSYMKNEVNI